MPSQRPRGDTPETARFHDPLRDRGPLPCVRPPEAFKGLRCSQHAVDRLTGCCRTRLIRSPRVLNHDRNGRRIAAADPHEPGFRGDAIRTDTLADPAGRVVRVCPRGLCPSRIDGLLHRRRQQVPMTPSGMRAGFDGRRGAVDRLTPSLSTPGQCRQRGTCRSAGLGGRRPSASVRPRRQAGLSRSNAARRRA